MDIFSKSRRLMFENISKTVLNVSQIQRIIRNNPKNPIMKIQLSIISTISKN